MSTDKKKTEDLRAEVDDDPTLEFEVPAGLRHAGNSPEPEIELDENTYDIDEPSDPSANLSKSELKLTVRAQADRIGELEYEFEQLTSRYRGLSEELKAREEIANTLNDETARARNALREAEAAIRSRTEEHETLQSALDRSNERASGLEHENKALQEQLADVRNQAEGLRSQLDGQDRTTRKPESDPRVTLRSNETRQSSDDKASQRVSELQTHLDAANAELADLRNYVDQHKVEWDRRSEEQTDSSTSRSAGEHRGAGYSEQAATIKGEPDSARSQIEKIRASLKEQKQATKALRRENRDLKRALDGEAGIELERLRELSARQTGEIAAVRREAERLGRDNERLESYADSLRMQLQDQISIAKVSVAIRTKLEKGLDIAEARLAEMGAELQDARSQAESLQSDFDRIRDEHEREIRQIRFELGAAQETLTDQETINEQLASDLINHQNYKQALESRLDESEQQRSRTVQDLTEQLESARSDADDLERKLRIKDAAIADLMKELANADSKIELNAEIDTGLHGVDGFKTGSPTGKPRKSEKDKLARLLIGNADGRELRFPLFKDRLTIGRTSHNDIQLNMQFISRRHAVIATDNGKTRVIDWGSKNGVYVNKVRVSEKILESGDIVTIGTTDFRYEERPKR
jgi:chromosome segregation ATPase